MSLITSRRRFFSLLAAPAIVSITGKVHAALGPLQPSVIIKPNYLIVPSHNEALVQSMIETQENIAASVLDREFYHRFREIVMPGLRDYFDEAYKDMLIDDAVSDRIRSRS